MATHAHWTRWRPFSASRASDELTLWKNPGALGVTGVFLCRELFAVDPKNLPSPGAEVSGALTTRLVSDPQFKVLWAVIVLHAIDVVNILRSPKAATE